MKALFLLLVLGGAGYGGYCYLDSKKESEALQFYKEFCQDRLYGRYHLCYPKLGAHEARWALEEDNRLFQMNASMRGTVLGSSYDVQSEKPSADGNEVALQLVQTVRVNPAGETSTLGREVVHAHDAKVQRVNGQWKVISFKDEVRK